MSSSITENIFDTLDSIFKQIVIRSESECEVAGETISVKNGVPQHLNSYLPTQPSLLAALSYAIYVKFYSCAAIRKDDVATSSDVDMTPLLQSANRGCTKFERGWVLESITPDSRIIARKRGVRRLFNIGEFSLEGSISTAPPTVGTEITAFFPNEAINLQPGFYHAMHYSMEDVTDPLRMIRFYFNIKPEGAGDLVDAITGLFIKVGVPYRFKIANRAKLFERRDPSVLIVPQRFYDIAIELLAIAYDRIAHKIRREVPLFTKKLADGFAFAEAPANGESFGINRCRILAEAAIEAVGSKLASKDACLEGLKRILAKEGNSQEYLYLLRSQVDFYRHMPIGGCFN
jgi:hypothetical protein